MGPKCHTEAGESWDSSIEGGDDGFFTIDEVDGGNFTGLFNNDPRDPISGTCTGATIDFTRTAISKTYSGVFHGAGAGLIRGIRRRHRRDDADKKGKPDADDETWDGTKTGGGDDEEKKHSKKDK
jgi:hypothetical protein